MSLYTQKTMSQGEYMKSSVTIVIVLASIAASHLGVFVFVLTDTSKGETKQLQCKCRGGLY